MQRFSSGCDVLQDFMNLINVYVDFSRVKLLFLHLFSDSPLDLKIKSHLVSDMFNLIGE